VGILTRRILVLITAMFLISVAALPVLAAPAPPVVVHDAAVMRNAFETGDLLVFFEASLPEINWAATPDDALTRLTSVGAATVYQERPNPAIGTFLTGFYLEPGHGIPWLTTDLAASIISNPTSFDTVEVATYPIDASNYITTTGLIFGDEANGAIVCGRLVAMLQDVELMDPAIGIGQLVDTYGQITDDGLAMSRHIISSIAFLLSTCFPVGSESSSAGFDPSGTGAQASNLQTGIETTPTWTRFDAFAVSVGFTNTGYLAAILALVAAVIVILVTLGMSGSIQFAMAGGAVMLFAGSLLAPGVLFQGVMITIAFIFMSLGAFVFQRMPR